ncbi:peptidoglycan recognition family protein [Candidatus Riflebacteria bacterium]
MKKTTSFYCIIISLLFAFCHSPVAVAQEHASYIFSQKLNFALKEGESFRIFKTPVLRPDKDINCGILSVQIQKGKGAVVRSYIRLRFAGKKRFLRFRSFDVEFHFAKKKKLAEYQLLFMVLDPKSGQSRIKGFSMRGEYLPEDKIVGLYKGAKTRDITFKPWKKPAVVSRAAWKARPPKGEYIPHEPHKVVIHHSYIPTQNDYVGSQTIRDIQNFHMDDKDHLWNDIGYHFLIGTEGTIFQGRPEKVVGAHAVPNPTMVGICLIGNYDPEADILIPAMKSSLVNLLSWLSSTYKISTVFYYGHRDFSPKSCPGETVYEKLPELKKLVEDNILEAN